MIIIIDREYSRSILFSEPCDYYYYRPRVLIDREYSQSILFSVPMTIIIIILARSITKRLQNDSEKTKTAFFFKLSHNMGHIMMTVCIRFGGILGSHLGLATNFLKTIRWA